MANTSCPSCGTKLISASKDYNAWAVCPCCVFSGYILEAILENSNTDVETVLRQPEKIRALASSLKASESDILGLLRLVQLRNSVGDVRINSEKEFITIINKFCRDDQESVKPLPMWSLTSKFIDKNIGLFTKVSRHRLTDYRSTGLVLPLFQRENELVGYNIVYTPKVCASALTNEKYAWITYLQDMYLDTERAFLSYAPDKFTNDKTLLITNDIVSYWKLLYWYQNTGEKYLCILVSGEMEPAMDLLSNYLWHPKRIIMLCNHRSATRYLGQRMAKGSPLQTGQLLTLNAEKFSTKTPPTRSEETRQELDRYIRQKFRLWI